MGMVPAVGSLVVRVMTWRCPSRLGCLLLSSAADVAGLPLPLRQRHLAALDLRVHVAQALRILIQGEQTNHTLPKRSKNCACQPIVDEKRSVELSR